MLVAIQPFLKYADFTGRARRAEFWWFVLLVFVLEFVVSNAAFNYGLNPKIAVLVFWLAVLTPCFAVMARRLHDSDRSSRYLIIPFLFVAMLVFAVRVDGNGLPGMVLAVIATASILILAAMGWFTILMLWPGTEGKNRYGVQSDV